MGFDGCCEWVFDEDMARSLLSMSDSVNSYTVVMHGRHNEYDE